MSESTDIVTTRPAAPRRQIWKRLVAVFLVLVVGAGLAVWWKPALLLAVVRLVRGDSADPEVRREALEKLREQEQSAAAQPPGRDAEFRQAMLGSWTQSRSDAERELLLRPDGTGLQVIKPKGWATTFLGERVELDVVWKVENGRAIFDSLTGRPADKAQLVNDLFGTHRDRRIVEITGTRILLFDEKDNQPSEWQRAAGGPDNEPNSRTAEQSPE